MDCLTRLRKRSDRVDPSHGAGGIPHLVPEPGWGRVMPQPIPQLGEVGTPKGKKLGTILD